MACKDRMGNTISEEPSNNKVLEFLYETNFGENCLKVVTKPFVSKLGRKVLKSKLSSSFIDSFVKKNNINMDEYEGAPFESYNDFFMRKIKSGARDIDMVEGDLISPCDSKLTVHKIDENGKFNIKNVEYSFSQLTRSKKFEREFQGGYLLIFRLSVDDYHRYCYVDNGRKSSNLMINGIFHTVQPIAADSLPIYKENQREISLLKSDNFGDIIMMEVGALMVGKIVNYHSASYVKRGMEKGRFEFGGSTVILAFKKGKIIIDEDIMKNSEEGFETKVKLGEKIGVKKQ